VRGRDGDEKGIWSRSNWNSFVSDDEVVCVMLLTHWTSSSSERWDIPSIRMIGGMDRTASVSWDKNSDRQIVCYIGAARLGPEPN
jgi:hypothetical protein